MRTSIIGTFILLTSGAMTDWASGREDPPKKQTDAEITKLFIGKWDSGIDEGVVKVKSITVINKDGTFKYTSTLTVQDKDTPISLEGTWKVSKGVVVSTVTKTSVPEMIKKGHMEKIEVISIDEKLLRYKDDKGKERVDTRAK